ncbi:tumor necrosis factor receptor superfamily member 12A [Dendrobates tinctorius]|uniref:tumor necrosis factor receptor superfamily member 12A n=1 Tax=Dendrobates tinctorius TaxID=92724 RepID=UPI003CCA2581
MAMVTGLIPILRTALEATTDYSGRTMWFGFAVVRLLALYVSELPWSKLDLDFDCRGNETSEFCRKACFSDHFQVPVVSTWNSAYVFFVASVLLMELFTSQLRHNLTKATMRKKMVQHEGPLVGAWSSDLAHKDLVLDFHQQRTLLLLYLLCILLRLLGSGCAPGMQWSSDLGKCKDCKICDTSSKDDFCQKCEDSDKLDFPWLMVISVTAVSVFFVTLVLGLAIYLVRCRPKKKFTTPIEETGAHSAEELLIH